MEEENLSLFLILCIMPSLHPIFFSPFSFFLMWTIFIKSYCSIYLYFYRNHTQYSQVTVLQSGQEQDKASTLMEPNYRKSAEFKGSDPILRGSLSTRRMYLTCLEEYMRWKNPNEHSLNNVYRLQMPPFFTRSLDVCHQISVNS